MTTSRSLVASSLACLFAAAHVFAQAPPPPQVIQGPGLETFLSTAKITASKDIGKGLTIPLKLTMELDGLIQNAVFKSIDEKPHVGITTLADGTLDAEFQDSWKTEIAAYELDKLLDLGIVPATVARRHDSKAGSVQFWVTSKMNEDKRQKENIAPPDASAWNDQMHKLFVWDNLIYNVDRNHGNILITDQWRLIAIDHSRSFRPYKKLKNEKLMVRFSRSMLAKMVTLDAPTLKAKLGDYLTPFQIQGVLKRRDLIVAYAKNLAAKQGDAAVYYQ